MTCGDGRAPFAGWQSPETDETMMQVDMKHKWVHGNSSISTAVGTQSLFHLIMSFGSARVFLPLDT